MISGAKSISQVILFYRRAHVILHLGCVPALLYLVVGCSTLGDLDKPNPNSFFKRDLEFKVDKKNYRGVGVEPTRDYYKLEFKTPAELVRLYTCHRDLIVEKPKAKFTYDYHPTSIEKEEVCPLMIKTYDKDKQHRWAMLDFYRAETLLATVQCNGVVSNQYGVSTCQTKRDLLQQVSFKHDVKAYSSCTEVERIGKNIFRYKAPKGVCQILFGNAKERHRHVVLGYDDFIFRKL